MYTPDGDNWVSNAPKVLMRGDMMTNTVDNFGFLETFKRNETFRTNDILRTEDGGYTISEKWSDFTFNEMGAYNMLGGLIRSPELYDGLLGYNAGNMIGTMTYVFDENYLVKSISCDITDTFSKNSYDLHVEVTFDWNNVNNIILPDNVTKVED